MTFDLEMARDLAANPIHCPETDEVFRKAMAEIERLKSELESLNIELMAAGEIVMAAKQLRAEGKIGPDVMPRSWQITDERPAGVCMTLDLEKARACAAFVDPKEAFLEALAEIERLQASLTDLHAEYINTLEKNPECSAWDLDEQSIEDQRRLRRNAAHAISIVEPPIYLQADQQATKIKSLKKEIRRLKHESKVEQEFTNSYIKHLHEAEARIKELEDALVDARGKLFHQFGDAELDPPGEDDRRIVQEMLRAEGKIGPDASKPRSWQITDERRRALSEAMTFLPEEYGGDTARIRNVLRAMLQEAGRK